MLSLGKSAVTVENPNRTNMGRMSVSDDDLNENLDGQAYQGQQNGSMDTRMRESTKGVPNSRPNGKRRIPGRSGLKNTTEERMQQQPIPKWAASDAAVSSDAPYSTNDTSCDLERDDERTMRPHRRNSPHTSNHKTCHSHDQTTANMSGSAERSGVHHKISCHNPPHAAAANPNATSSQFPSFASAVCTQLTAASGDQMHHTHAECSDNTAEMVADPSFRQHCLHDHSYSNSHNSPALSSAAAVHGLQRPQSPLPGHQGQAASSVCCRTAVTGSLNALTAGRGSPHQQPNSSAFRKQISPHHQHAVHTNALPYSEPQISSHRINTVPQQFPTTSAPYHPPCRIGGLGEGAGGLQMNSRMPVCGDFGSGHRTFDGERSVGGTMGDMIDALRIELREKEQMSDNLGMLNEELSRENAALRAKLDRLSHINRQMFVAMNKKDSQLMVYERIVSATCTAARALISGARSVSPPRGVHIMDDEFSGANHGGLEAVGGCPHQLEDSNRYPEQQAPSSRSRRNTSQHMPHQFEGAANMQQFVPGHDVLGVQNKSSFSSPGLSPHIAWEEGQFRTAARTAGMDEQGAFIQTNVPRYTSYDNKADLPSSIWSDYSMEDPMSGNAAVDSYSLSQRPGRNFQPHLMHDQMKFRREFRPTDATPGGHQFVSAVSHQQAAGMGMDMDGHGKRRSRSHCYVRHHSGRSSSSVNYNRGRHIGGLMNDRAACTEFGSSSSTTGGGRVKSGSVSAKQCFTPTDHLQAALMKINAASGRPTGGGSHPSPKEYASSEESCGRPMEAPLTQLCAADDLESPSSGHPAASKHHHNHEILMNDNNIRNYESRNSFDCRKTNDNINGMCSSEDGGSSGGAGQSKGITRKGQQSSVRFSDKQRMSYQRNGRHSTEPSRLQNAMSQGKWGDGDLKRSDDVFGVAGDRGSPEGNVAAVLPSFSSTRSQRQVADNKASGGSPAVARPPVASPNPDESEQMLAISTFQRNCPEEVLEAELVEGHCDEAEALQKLETGEDDDLSKRRLSVDSVSSSSSSSSPLWPTAAPVSQTANRPPVVPRLGISKETVGIGSWLGGAATSGDIYTEIT